MVSLSTRVFMNFVVNKGLLSQCFRKQVTLIMTPNNVLFIVFAN